ncbi:MAG: hypothetical protein BWY52_02926 [Chloroflexi bacterium ADurb.Bin325]|nr:MAG: hypothetical protein BWY52_02926 [Chloroflexi bacterium ADurb.Bin325]
MADELAQKAGIDKATAQKSLQEVLAALSQQRRDQAPGSGQAKSGGMDDLLFKPNR